MNDLLNNTTKSKNIVELYDIILKIVKNFMMIIFLIISKIEKIRTNLK